MVFVKGNSDSKLAKPIEGKVITGEQFVGEWILEYVDYGETGIIAAEDILDNDGYEIIILLDSKMGIWMLPDNAPFIKWKANSPTTLTITGIETHDIIFEAELINEKLTIIDTINNAKQVFARSNENTSQETYD